MGLCCVIGATRWLGVVGHELGERESEQRERKSREQRTERAHMPVWLGRSWDNEKDSRDNEKEKEQR